MRAKSQHVQEFFYIHAEIFLIGLTVLMSIVSFFYFYQAGLTMEYGDARAHVNISRRVYDNLTPGFAQLGGVWLPLLHVLMLPTIWNNWMWHSGLSGSIISMIAFLIGATYLYRLMLVLTKSKGAAFIGILLMITNINLLYLQATPMTESLFLCTLIMSVYYLTLWTTNQQTGFLIVSGIMIYLTTINRYEGWPVAVVSIMIVGWVLLAKQPLRKAESRVILYTTIALMGIALWLIWQLAIFHDPLYFLHSEYSAEKGTEIFFKLGYLPTKGNIYISILAFYYSLLHVVGFITIPSIVLLACSLSIFLLFLTLRKIFYEYLPSFLFVVPGLFLIYTLFQGNIPLWVPEIKIPGQELQYFNVRYALYSLPAIVLFPSLFLKNNYIKLLFVVVIVINAYTLLPHNGTDIATIYDTRNKIFLSAKHTADWLKSSYKGGYIMASAAAGDSIMFQIGTPLNKIISEGSGYYWKDSLKNPEKFASWVIISRDGRDSLQKKINKISMKKNFTLIKDFDYYKIYHNNQVIFPQ